MSAAKRNARKVTSVVLSCLLCFSMSPFSAWGEVSSPSNSGSVSDDQVETTNQAASQGSTAEPVARPDISAPSVDNQADQDDFTDSSDSPKQDGVTSDSQPGDQVQNPSVQLREAKDLTADRSLVTLSSEGLTLNKVEDAQSEDDPQLHQTGMLDVAVNIAAGDVISGDTVVVDLPSKIVDVDVFSNQLATQDAFRTVKDGADYLYKEKIGSWRISGDSLVLTLEDLSSVKSASVAEGVNSFMSQVRIPVALKKDALNEKPFIYAWYMTRLNDGRDTKVDIAVPATGEIAEFADDSSEEPPADDDDADADSNNPAEVLPVQKADASAALGESNPLFGLLMLLSEGAEGNVEVTYEFEGFADKSYTVNFADNANPNRPATDDIAAASKLTFTIEVDGKQQTFDFKWDNARDYLHMTEDQFVDISVVGENESSTKEVFTAADLPTNLKTTTTTTTPSTEQKTDPDTGEPMVDQDGRPVMEDPTVETKTTDTAIDWSLVPDFGEWTNAGLTNETASTGDWDNKYLFEDKGENTYQANLVTVRQYHFEMVEGEYKATTEELLKLLETTAAHFNIDLGDGNEQNLASVMADNDIRWDYKDGILTFYNLPAYTLDNGKPLDVSIVYTGAPKNPTEETGIYYTAVYNNAAAPNHGADDQAVFPGGTLRLIRSGIVDFSATKTWVDTKDDANRSTVTYKLYRYREGQSFANAAPVVGADGSYVTVEVVPPAAVDGNSVTIDGNLNANLNGLAKYDPEGYEYYYELRPGTGSDNGYDSIYGTLNDTGAYNNDDTLPKDVARDSHDAGIYDGGTLTVRRSGTVTLDPTKTWHASAFQNQLNDVSCLFTLMRSADKGTTWSKAADGEGADITCRMDGFSEEQMKKKFSDCGAQTSFPEFDELGRPLQYKWAESSVTQGEKVIELNSASERNEFTLDMTDPVTGDAIKVDFVSTFDEDGNIINAYVKDTSLGIEKFWYAGDDDKANYTQAPVAGENDWPEDANFTATFKLYQDGKYVCDLTADGQQGTVTSLANELGGEASCEEVTPYNLVLSNVPLFTDAGMRHSYLVLEKDEGVACITDRVYSAKTQTTSFYNRPSVEGESSEINVSKNWRDAGDGHGNAVVNVDLVAKHDLVYTKEAKDDEGNLLHSVGDIYKCEGETVATVSLSASDEWFKIAYIPVDGVTFADLELHETSVAQNGKTYNVVEGDDAILQLLKDNGITAGQEDLKAFPNHRAVVVNGHVYSVGTGYTNGELNSLEVSNTRVGWSGLDATKAWVDEGADKDKRPNCSLEISVTSGNATVETNDDGAMSIKVGDTSYPVMVSVDGAEAKACTTDDLKMLKDKDSQSWAIRYLPKYDKYGNAITYSLSEKCDAAGMGEYVAGSWYNGATVDGLHYAYAAGFGFSNQRAQTTSATFTKKWRDDYVYTMGMRPDIFLTLYKLDSDGFSPVDGFIDVKWGLDGDNDGAGNGGSDVVSTAQGTNLQTITINDLPKYDSKGFEITYYASEAMSVKGSTLDYLPVYYDAGDTVISTDDGSVVAGEQASGDGTAVRYGGTFNNDIAATQSVKGEKAWADVPTGFLSADFPAVTITVKHNQPSHPDQADVLAAVIQLDPKNFSGSRWSYETGCMTNAAGEYIDANGIVVTSADDAAKFPMYDEYGKKYTYYVQEYDIKIDPAAPVVGEVDQAAQDKGAAAGAIIYKPEYDQTGKTFRITNTYKGGSADRNLTVTKKYDLRSKDDRFPTSLTFKLYRTYYSKSANNGAGGYIDPQYVDQMTMSESDFTADSGTSEASKAFKNLEIYAPNGYLWEYYVEESATDAYTQDAKVTATGNKNQNPSVYALDTSSNGQQGQGAVAGVVTLNSGDGAVEFDNNYTPNMLTLTGAKIWDDQENAFRLREQFLKDGAVPLDFVTLKRVNASGTMTEDVELQTTDATAANYIKWDTTGDAAKWTYSIENLEYWAPDSTAWKYTVTERDTTKVADEATGYKAVVKAATCTNEAKDGDNYKGSFADLKNSLDGSVKVTKAWNDGDTHKLRPTQIKVQLQARLAGGEWQDAASFLGGSYTTDDDQTLSGNMTYTWSKLPIKMLDGPMYKTVEYRVVETEIGAAGNDAAVTPNAVSTDASAGASYSSIEAGTYTVSAETTVKGSATTTALTNSRDYVSLNVKKVWTDFDNKWGTRPANDSVTMKIESSTDGTNWTQVKKADGSDLTITLSSAKAETSVGDLPRLSGTTPISYRAIEVTTGDGVNLGGYTDSYRIGTSGDYAKAEDFTGASASAAGTDDAPASISEEVNNSLKYVNVKGTKQFNAYANDTYYDPTAEGNAPTMHVWRTVDGGKTWEKAFLADGTTEPTLTWTKANETGLYSFEIDNLPAADNQGNEYTYQVSEDVAWANKHGFVVTQDSEHGNASTVDKTGDTVVWTANSAITNTPTKFRIDKAFAQPDLYTDMSQITGGTYTVTGTFADGSTSQTVEIAAGATKSSSVLEGQLIPGNTYTLTETAAPDGYKQLGGTVKFTVNADGTITMGEVKDGTVTDGSNAPANGSVEASVDSDSGVSVVKVTDLPVQVKLNKVLEGSTDKASGVQFTLEPVSTNGYYLTDAGAKETAAKTVTTDTDGTVTMTGLVVGQKYKLTETSSSHANALVSPYTFTVNANGTVAADAEDANWVVGTESDGAVATLTATDPYIGLTVQKLDSAGTAVSQTGRVNGNDKTGMGTWKITPVNGSAFSDGTTDAQTLSYVDGVSFLKHGGTYTVVEATAPWGYEKNGETLFVTVSDDGVISIASYEFSTDYALVTASRNAGANTVATVSLKNNETEVTLNKVSTAQDNPAVKGATFTVTGKFVDGSTSKDFATGSNASSVTINGLITGEEYKIKESVAPAGYKVEESEVTITLKADGTLDAVTGADANGWSQGTGTAVSFTKADVPIKVGLVKYDETGHPLKGSTFTVTGVFAAAAMDGTMGTKSETRTFADTSATSTGCIAIDRLVAGQEYVITETVPPAGYVNASGTDTTDVFSAKIKVTSTGGVEFVGKPTGEWRWSSPGNVALWDVKTSLDFVKWGAEATADANGQKTGIDGATFTVKGVFAGSDAEQERTFTTGTDTAMEGFIVGNTYTVTETTAPEGYAACADSFTFTVNQDGSINATPTADWKIASGGKGLVLVDSLTDYGLFKASNDNTLAPNAEFQIKGKMRLEDGTIADRNVAKVGTAGGIASMKGLLEGESYEIVETKAPDYHVPDTTPYTFKIKDGIIVSDDANTAWAISDDGKSITMTDVVIRPTLTKTASNNAAVPGAQFTVYTSYAEVVGTFTTDSDGKAQLPALLANTGYVVGETITPAGCLTAAQCALVVSADGVVSIYGTPEHWSISDDGTMLSVEDQLVTATLHKTGDTATAGTKVDLPGAVYEITGKFASTSFVAVEETRTFTTGAGGTVALTGLVTGETYTVHEKTPPAGYVAGPDFEIEIDAAGKVSISSNPDSADASVANNVITVNDERTNPLMGKSDFEHAKWDADDEHVIGAGNPIAGATATFSFTPTGTSTFADGSVDAKTAVVDASKDVSLANSLANATQLADLGFVVGNTYEVEEIAAPAGYSVSTVNAVVRVKSDGTFEYVDPDDVGFRWLLDDNGVLVSLDSKIRISFEKADTNGYRIYDYCEYQVWPADGSAFADGTTAARTIRVNYKEPGNQSYFVDSISGVVAGNTYIIKESKAPVGYAASDVEYSFRVDSDGKFTQVAEAVGWTIGDAYGTGRGTVIRAMDKPNNIRVTKLETQVFGASDHHTLPGVKFTLTDLGTDGNGANANNPAATTLTAAPNSGDLEFQKLLSGHRYSLVESETVPGFAINGNAVTFSISDTGVFSFDPMPAGWTLDVSTEKPSLSCYDATRVGVKKVDADSNALKGASFTVTGTFNDGTSKTITTDENGLAELLDQLKISFKENPAIYTIKEAAPAPGYLPSTKEVNFYILDKVGLCLEGSTTPITDGDLGDGWAFKDGNFVVTDQPVVAKLKKTDGTNALSGAKFSITPTGTVKDAAGKDVATTFADGTSDAQTFTSDDNGIVDLISKLIVGGTYVIEETQAPTGYMLPTGDAAKLTLTVSDAGVVSRVDGEGKGTLAADFAANNTITVSDAPLSFTITKKSANGNTLLKGAEFKVAGAFADGSSEKTFAVNDSGKAKIDGIKAGETYTVTETKAPAGFAKADGSFTFSVDTSNKAIIGYYTGSDYASASSPVTAAVTDPADGTVGCTFLDNPLKVAVAKSLVALGPNDQNADAYKGLTAAGAKFQLAGKFWSADSNAVAAGTVEHTVSAADVANGVFFFEGLVAGEEYTLTEVQAPSGYACAPAFTFKVNADANGNGDNTITTTATNDVAVGTYGTATEYPANAVTQLTVSDKPLVLTLSKFAAAENDGGKDTVLNGPMEYTVAGTFMVNGTKTANSQQTVTVGQGANSATLAGLIEGESYTISETKAPSGYASMTTPLSVTVTGGKLDFAAGEQWKAEADNGMAVDLVNKKTSVSFEKLDANGAKVSGCVLTLTDKDNNQVDKWTTDNALHIITGTLVEGQEYTLTETSPAAGYATAKPVTFTVSALNGATHAVTMIDAQTSLKITKVDADGNALGDCVMQVTHKDGENTLVDEEWTTSVEAGKTDHVITGKLVEGREYTLTEATPAPGYTKAEDQTFTVAAGNGAVQSVSMKNVQTSFSLAKTNADGSSKLAGAEFELTGAVPDASSATLITADTNVTTIESGDDGTITLTGKLIAGKSYTLKETVAPKGYKLDQGTFSFKVEDNGTITVVANDTDASAWSLAEGNAISLADASVNLTVKKLSNDGTTVLSDTTLAVTPKEGSAFADGTTTAKKLTTGADGTVNYDGQLVEGGKYTISETAVPAGYTIAKTLDVKVDSAQGGVVVDGTAPDCWSYADGVASLVNQKTKVSFAKTNADGTVVLSGTTFTVTPADGSAFAAAQTDNKIEVTTNADGKAALDNGLLVIENTYNVAESAAPKGYLPRAAVQLKVADDGTLSFVGDHDGWTLDGTCLKVADVPVSVSVAKFDGATSLEGYTIKIDGPIYENGVKVADTKTVEVTGSTYEFTDCLETGVEYTLTETTAPANHMVAAGTCAFTVDTAGKVTIKDGSDSAFTVDTDNKTIKLNDEPINLTVKKLSDDAAPKALPRAEYTLTPAPGVKFADGTNKPKTLTTDAKGMVVFEGLVKGGIYQVTETKAPEGYMEGEPIIVQVDHSTGLITQEGNATGQAGNATGWTVSENGRGVLTQSDTKTSFTVTKLDADGAEVLPGSEFTLTGSVADANAENGVTDDDHESKLTLGDDGTIKMDGLLIARQHYTLTETTAPLGYACHTAPLGFSVDAKGSITFDEGDTAYQLGADNAISLKDDQISFSVRKVDKLNNDLTLAGAEYTIKPASENDKLADGAAGVLESGVVKATTNENGIATFTGNLVVGNSYTIEETGAPTGYTRDTTVHTLKVNAGGEVILDDATAQNAEDAYVPQTDVVMTDIKTTFVISNVSSENGSELPRAHYVVKSGNKYLQADGSLGDEPYEFITDDEGKLDISGVLSINVDYELEQVDASNGYKLNHGSFAFSLDEHGNVVPKDLDPDDERYTFDENGVLIMGADDPIVLNVAKTDMAGKALDDAVFTVTPAKGSSFVDGAASHELTVSADDASLASLSAQLINGNTYVVSEIKAPAGYELCTDVTITVDADGKMTLEGDTDVWSLDGDACVLTAKDATMDMSLTKVADLSDVPLEGAVFKISGMLVGDDGAVSQRELMLDPTGADGLVDLRGKLVANETYTLTETAAPAGYKLTAPIQFKVDAQGNATLLDNPAGWTVSETGADFQVAEDPLSLVFSKVSKETGKALEGAKFTVEGKLANGENSLEFKTDEQGLYELRANLVLGETYTLTETEAPEGYEKVDPVTLVVAEDGSFELQGDYDKEAWILQDDGKTLKVADELTPEAAEAAASAMPLTGDAVGPLMALLACAFFGTGTLIARTRRKHWR